MSILHAATLPVDTPDGATGSAVPLSSLNTLFANILNVIVEIAAVVLFLMIVVGGFKYLTSGGNPKATESAKMTLTYAIFGMVIVAAAFLIIQLIEQFTGAPINNFNVVGGP